VISIEPLQRFSYLQHGLPSNCSVRRLALSSAPGSAEIRVPVRDGFVPAQLATIEPANTLSGSKFIVETVRLTTLDLELTGEDVGFIKIDVEGHELDVLLGAEETVARCRPRFLVECEERHSPGAVDRLAAWVARHEYQAFFLWKGELRPLDEFKSHLHQRHSNIQLQGRVASVSCP
jgi:FkbM family methyltransferase